MPELWGQGKTVGLHSTVFLEVDDDNRRVNNGNYRKKAEKRQLLVKSG